MKRTRTVRVAAAAALISATVVGALVTVGAGPSAYAGRLLAPAQTAQMHQTVAAPEIAAVLPGANRLVNEALCA